MRMTHKKSLLQIKLLTFVTTAILASVLVNYYWINRQNIASCDKSSSLSGFDTDVAKLKTAIKNNHDNQRNQLSKIESKMALLHSNIQFLMARQKKTVSPTDQGIQKNIQDNSPVSVQTSGLNEYKSRKKTREGEKLEKTMVQDNESRTHAREELMKSMVQDSKSDPEWSMEARESLYEAFAADETHSIYLENAECGATICQATLYLDGTTEFEDRYNEILSLSPWSSQAFAQIDDESGSIEFYLAREGHELPDIEEPTIADQ